jgi:glutamate--cysteine ligase
MAGERPLHALRERGVEYVEVRLMDLDPFEPVGISAATMRFLDVFLLHCLLSESPADTPEEVACVSRNQECVAQRGREPGLKLGCGSGDRPLREWGEKLLAECASVAAAVDAALGGGAYREALARQLEVLRDPALTPSARVLLEMQRKHASSYTEFVREISARHRDTLKAKAFPVLEQERFARLAAESLEEQKRIEASDALPFEEYRKKYLAVERLGVQT